MDIKDIVSRHKRDQGNIFKVGDVIEEVERNVIYFEEEELCLRL